MSFKKIRKKVFGTCCFCGGKTSFYKFYHSECEKRFFEGCEKILLLNEDICNPELNIYFCDALIENVKQNNFVNEEEKKHLLIEVCEKALEKHIQDTEISDDFENNFKAFMEHYELSSEDLNSKGLYTKFIQQIVLKQVALGIIPEYVRLSSDIIFNFMKDEKIIWAFPDVKCVIINNSSNKEINGNLVMTNKHMYFISGHQDFRIKYEKIISFMLTDDGLHIQRNGLNLKPLLFVMDDDEYAFKLLKLLTEWT